MRSIWEFNFKDLVSPGIAKMQSAVGKTFANISMYENQLQNTMNSTSSSVQKQNSLFSGLGGTVASALGYAGAIGTVTALGYGVLKIGSSMEQTRTAFNVLLGDVGLANSKLKELQEFADVSPFDNAQTFEAAQSLLGYSVEAKKLIPIMNFLGDASLGNATKFAQLVDNYGKMNTTQLAHTVDLNQFANAGVPIWAELEKIVGKSGVALHKYVEQNGVSIGVIDQIFTKLNSKGGMFYDMMKKQSETVAGKWSTMISKMQSTAVKIYEHMKPFMKQLIDLGTIVLPIVESALRTIWNTGKGVLSFFKEHKGVIYMVAGAVGAYALAWVGANIAMTAAGLIMGIMEVAAGAMHILMATWALLTGNLTIAQWALNVAMTANPIGIVAAAIGVLVGGIIYAWTHFEGFRKMVYGLWDAFKQVFTNIGSFFGKIFNPIFEAITAFKEGRYGDAAKAVGMVAFNVATLPMQAAVFAAHGGFNKGVTDAYDKGALKGVNKPSTEAKTSSPTETGALPFSSKAGSAGAGAAGSDAGGSSSSASGGGKNVTINIHGGLVGKMVFENSVHGLENMKEKVKEALLSVVNETELAV